MSVKQLDILTSPRFFPLFITQFFGAFNDNVFKNALVMLVTYRIASQTGQNAQILVTLAAGVFILPFFLFSATAGQLADKFEKSRLISVIKFAEVILMLLASVGFYSQSVLILMTVLFFLGAQAAFFGPVKYAILPNLLQEEELIAGNGLIEAGTFLSILLGTIVGGVLILLPAGDYIISAAICLVSLAGFVSSLFVKNTGVKNLNIDVRYNFILETIRVIKYSRTHRDIFLCILGISWFWLVGATFLAEIPVFAKDILHANEHVVTFFIATFSIGIAIGSLLCNRLSKGQVEATYVPLGALGITLFTLDLYFASSHVIPMSHLITLSTFLQSLSGWRITIDLMCIAICGGIYTVPLYALLQIRSEPSHRARVIASNNVINALFMVIAAMSTLFMLEIGYTVIQVFLVIALLNAVVAVYISQLVPHLVFKALLRWVLRVIYNVNIIGLENYKQAGKRVVIVANHTSFLDAALLSAFLPGNLTYAIDTETAKKWWIKFFIYLVDTFPMHPTNPMAIKSLIDYVKQDKHCVIFPEGRLTMTGALMKIYEGPGLITDKAKATLLPIRIQGAQLTPFSRLRGKVPIKYAPQITLTIFKAQSMDISPTIRGRERRQLIGLKLYDLMRTMMFESSDYHQTLFHSLLNAKSMHGRSYTIVEDINRQPLNYQQFITRSFILGHMIAKQTMPGDHVGILLPNSSTTAICFFALQAYCRVPAMLNFSAGTKSILIACQTAMITDIYTSLEFVRVAKLEELVETLSSHHIKIHYLESARKTISIVDKLRGKLFAQAPMFAYRFINRTDVSRALINPEEASVILFTSGSEGTPKGVVLSHKNIQANRYQLSACVDFTISDKILNTLPVFHSFGLTAGMMLPILSGVSVFFYPSPLHYRIVPQLAYDINATIMFGTDTFLAGYAKYAHPYDFYSIRYVFAGAEKLRDETLMIWARKFGVRIFDGYGATEASPVISTNTPMQNHPGTVGRFLPSIEYQIKPVPGISEGGLLFVSGPNVMKGYLLADNPGKLIPPENNWYDTGDVVSINSEGYITIKGRIKRFAKIGGEMVSLTMVEQQINQLWPEHQHAVINIPDAKKGEQIVLITTFPDAKRDAVMVFFQQQQISEIAIPKKIMVTEALPLLGSGKIDYSTIKEKYGAV